ncbi:ABC transporter permease [Metallumcola ferriviriculae]|uniref:ABC transporter permease n=1 Tax=Metallumcola ferriviriculae TaxID=3039180 RepID=A0AAU0UKW5_9FIRM|nr:ABC transporter permease [Desulfitibacteraceae bacterium MK1]
MTQKSISAELFQPVKSSTGDAEVIVRPSVSYRADAWQRLKQNKAAIAGLIIILLLITMAIIGPHLNKWSYSEQVLANANEAPSSEYWFGTDSLGRDLFTRVWYGARISLMIGFITSVSSILVGTIYGSISGYFGGRVDDIMMRIVEIFYGVPFLLYVILLMLIMEPGLKTIIIALGAVYWMGTARIVRGQVLKLKQEEFVLAAKTLGGSAARIILRHLIPNSMGPIIVMMTLTIPEAIFTEAFLSFLGLGVGVPKASWGYLANDGIQAIRSFPWQLLFPAFFISLTMLAFNLLGDGLRDVSDPRMRK